jgi:predicted NBD/HSP70 family sugar kinase
VNQKLSSSESRGNHTGDCSLDETVLRLIWNERKTTRAEISRRVGLSRSTVSEIVDNLLKTGLIAETGEGESSGGRRPIVLEFQDTARCLLGVDVGATHVSVVLTDLRGRVIDWQEKSHPVRTDPEGTRALVIEFCDSLLSSHAECSNRLMRIGVAVPSPVDPLNPKSLSEIVIPAWQGKSGLEQLQLHFGVPVHIDNDANLGALAEQWWGSGKGVDDFVFIKISHGIGAGYILGGSIYRGARGIAGEMGHLPLDPRGKKCVCGLRGCLATIVSGPAILERAEELLGEYPESSLRKEDLTIRAIENAVLDHDPLAQRLLVEFADYLGIALAGWFNLMNPRLVVLGGIFSRLGDRLLERLREKVRRSTLVSSAAGEIKTSDLGDKAVAIGAATLALDSILKDPRLFRHEAPTEAI